MRWRKAAALIAPHDLHATRWTKSRPAISSNGDKARNLPHLTGGGGLYSFTAPVIAAT
jgi:hypothetical protein